MRMNPNSIQGDVANLLYSKHNKKDLEAKIAQDKTGLERTENDIEETTKKLLKQLTIGKTALVTLPRGNGILDIYVVYKTRKGEEESLHISSPLLSDDVKALMEFNRDANKSKDTTQQGTEESI